MAEPAYVNEQIRKQNKMNDETKWQPIETAPKDGSHILAASSAGFRYIVLWDEDRSIWVRQDNETPCFPHNWQPLPAPPRRESVYSPTR